ncbi:hypothetical protein H0H92_004743 [Tricholoma furcatifolium]|nr:hypothetical protein H0H92_004743 [Tricholoma furcatifolium]
MHSPRSILKRSPASPAAPHLAVHFPPSPSLTTHTFVAYSAAYYDRSPIEVSPNSCALPERGCPGRTYTLDEQQPGGRARYHASRGLHPRAMQRQIEDVERSMACSSALPPLIPDLSSESDESDSFASPPTDTYPPSSKHVLGLILPQDRFSDYSSYDVDPYVSPITSAALAFLPHPPSSPSSRSPYSVSHDDDDDLPIHKPRRRRERKHDPSRTPDRIPDAIECPTIRTPTKKRVPALSRALTPRHLVSSFRVEDDGCLGGF